MMRRLRLGLALLALACSCCGEDRADARSPADGGSGMPQLQPGDIVCRYGEGIWSEFFRNSSTRDKRFSHVGILAFDAGEPFVIHASADDRSGIGEVREEPLSEFLAGARDVAIYRLGGEEGIGKRIAENARSYLGVPFDPAFDLASDERIYCSELVRLSVNAAAGEAIVTTSLMHGREIVAIDDCYLHPRFSVVYDRADGGAPAGGR